MVADRAYDRVEVGTDGMNPEQDHPGSLEPPGDDQLSEVVVRGNDDGAVFDGSAEDLDVVDARRVLRDGVHHDLVQLPESADQRGRDVLVGQQPQRHATVS